MKTFRYLMLISALLLFFSGTRESSRTKMHATKGCIWVFTTTYDDVRIQVSDGADNDCDKNNVKGPFHIKKGKEFKYTGSAKICYRREKAVGKNKDDWSPWMKATSKFDDGREEKIAIH